MRTVHIDPTPIGQMPLQDAFDLFFCRSTLEKVHGPSLRLGDWKEDCTRTIKFDMDIKGIPKEVARIFCGDKVRFSIRQSRKDALNQIEIFNKLKPHFLGAEFISIRPSFKLTHSEEDGTTYISGKVDNVARFPPPLNGIVEGFMAEQSVRELTKFRDLVIGGGGASPHDNAS